MVHLDERNASDQSVTKKVLTAYTNSNAPDSNSIGPIKNAQNRRSTGQNPRKGSVQPK